MATAEFSKFAGILSVVAASFFRILNSSTGIPSPLLALLVVMLPKAHLTSHSRMSGSRWVITPSCLSFLDSSVYDIYCAVNTISINGIFIRSDLWFGLQIVNRVTVNLYSYFTISTLSSLCLFLFFFFEFQGIAYRQLENLREALYL